MSDAGTITNMPAPSMFVPAQGEEMFPVRVKEWARLKQKISTLKRHRRQWSNLGWALIGIGASALLSWLPYLVSSVSQSWVPTATIVVGVSGLLAGVLALTFGRETQKSIEQAVHEVKVHMHDMESSLTVDQKTRIEEFAQIVLVE